jgi:hypothetical protein
MPGLQWYFQNPLTLLFMAFWLWMLVDAIRRQEWLWVLFLFLFPPLNTILYYFLVYRTRPSATSGFELPGTFNRKRIAELQSQIHHLDKAHHHAQLGDIYFQQGKLKEAEACYRAAIEREPNDPDFQAHLGQCLLRQERVQEAAPMLEAVVMANPKHDYGHTLMAYAEALAKLGHKELAVTAWRQVLDQHSYARARVQLAELYAELGRFEEARKEATDLLAEEKHTAAFQRKQDKVWTQRAKALLKKLPPQ